MIDKIRTYIQKQQLLNAEQPVLVGLSGGADSVALLVVLVRLGYDCRAAHCNFHLRGDESDRDEEFSRLFAKTLDVPFFKIDFNTKEYADIHHLSIEMAARELRYRWFDELIVQQNAQAIAVAHHQDDQLETILLNLVRGTGIRGLRGMLPRNGNIIRPLLPISKAELLEWLEKEKLTYVVDSTNQEIDYKRNYLRHEIIPALEKLNPSLRESVVRNAGYLSDVECIYDSVVEQAKKEIVSVPNHISIPALLTYTAPETILYELLKPYQFNRFVVQDIFDSLKGASGKIFESTTHRLVKDRDTLILDTRDQETDSMYEIHENMVSIAEPVKLSLQKIVLEKEITIDKNKTIAWFDYDKLSFPLILRKWRPGDWFIPFGMTGRKKLSDYFSDRKYSRPAKNAQWLLCSGNDIIWIVGERTDNRFRIEQSTNYVLIVKISG